MSNFQPPHDYLRREREAIEMIDGAQPIDWQSRCKAAEAALKASQDEAWSNWNSFKRVQTELAAIKGNARALLLKWDEIEADASFNGIFVLAAAHGMGYSGPNMTDETAVLRAATGASEATNGDDFAALHREKVALEIEVERLRADKGRLEFLISVLNCWNLYGRFLDEYHPTRKTTRERAEDAEWRQAIDGAASGVMQHGAEAMGPQEWK